MKSGSTSPVVWTERYEALRQHALNNRQSLTADPVGLVLPARHQSHRIMHAPDP